MDKENDQQQCPQKQVKEPLINALDCTVEKDVQRYWKEDTNSKDSLSKRKN